MTNFLAALLTPYSEIQAQRRELRAAADASIKRRETQQQLTDAMRRLDLDEVKRITSLPEWKVRWPI